MLLRSARELPSGEGWAFEPKWDGFRCLARLGEGTRLLSRRGRDLLPYLPELSELHRQAPLPMVLDGEVVAFSSGLPSFDALRARVFGTRGNRVDRGAVVLVVFDPTVVSYEELLKAFWENHDPTQGMRQGNDAGTQYRSAIYTYGELQAKSAAASRDAYQDVLRRAGYGDITTEIREAPPFYYAEDYHQQYLAKNPNGYCGLGGTGVSCPTGMTGA